MQRTANDRAAAQIFSFVGIYSLSAPIYKFTNRCEKQYDCNYRSGKKQKHLQAFRSGQVCQQTEQMPEYITVHCRKGDRLPDLCAIKSNDEDTAVPQQRRKDKDKFIRPVAVIHFKKISPLFTHDNSSA